MTNVTKTSNLFVKAIRARPSSILDRISISRKTTFGRLQRREK